MQTADTNVVQRAFDRFATITTLLWVVAFVVYEWLDHDDFTRQLKQEHSSEGAGIVEHLTFFVLIPGILCGLFVVWRWRERFASPLLRWWVFVWALACIYFAGEEVSWGYWYFGWETPEVIATVNDQGETNLHNMTSWLDQKPRALVELFVFIAGVALPLRRKLLGSKPLLRGRLAILEPWVIAPGSLIAAGLFFVAIRISKYLPKESFDNFGDSELREFAVAWFLGLYLCSYAVRLRRAQAAQP